MSDQTTKLAAGNYDMICTGEVQYGQSNNGTDQVGIELDIGGVVVTSILYFSPGAKPFSLTKLKACGWSGNGDIGSQIKGNTVKGRVKYEEYKTDQGELKTSMKVDIFDGGGGIVFQKPMSDSQKASFLTGLAQGAPAAPAGGYPSTWDSGSASTPATAPNGPKAGSFSLGSK